MFKILLGIVIVLLILFAVCVSGVCMAIAGIKMSQRRSFEEIFPNVFVGMVFLCVAITIIIMII